MDNVDRANKWYEIIERFTAVAKSPVSLKKWLLVSHYITFATEMWMMYIYKDMHKNF